MMTKSPLLLTFQVTLSFWLLTLIWISLQLDHLIPYAIKPDIALALAWILLNQKRALLGIFIGTSSSTLIHMTILPLDLLAHGFSFSLLHGGAVTLGCQLVNHIQRFYIKEKWYALKIKSYLILLAILATQLFITAEIDILYFYFSGTFEEAIVPLLSFSWYIIQLSGVLIITPFILAYSLRRRMTSIMLAQTFSIVFMTSGISIYVFYGRAYAFDNIAYSLLFLPFFFVSIWWQNIRALTGCVFMLSVLLIISIMNLHSQDASTVMLYTFNKQFSVLSLLLIVCYLGMIYIRNRANANVPSIRFTHYLPPSPIIALTLSTVGYTLSHVGLLNYQQQIESEQKQIYLMQTNDFSQQYFRAFKARNLAISLLSNQLTLPANESPEHTWHVQAQQLLIVYPDIEAIAFINQQLFIEDAFVQKQNILYKNEHIRLFVDDIQPFYTAIVDNKMKIIPLAANKIGLILPYFKQNTFTGFVYAVIDHALLANTFTPNDQQWLESMYINQTLIVDNITKKGLVIDNYNTHDFILSPTQAITFKFSTQQTFHTPLNQNQHRLIYITILALNMLLCGIVYVMQHGYWKVLHYRADLKTLRFKYHDLKSTMKHLKEYYHARHFLLNRIAPHTFKEINNMHGFIKKLQAHEKTLPNDELLTIHQHLSSNFLDIKKNVQDILILSQESGSLSPINIHELKAYDYIQKLAADSLLKHYHINLEVNEKHCSQDMSCTTDEKILRQAMLIIISTITDIKYKFDIELSVFPAFHQNQRMVFFAFDFVNHANHDISYLSIINEPDTIHDTLDSEDPKKFQLQMAKKLMTLIRGNLEYTLKLDDTFSILIKIPTHFS